MNFNTITFDRAFGISSQLPPSDFAEVAFAGRSNVGKSSLINKLANRKNLARTSSVPGKTITINFYKADGANLVDLPGYGYAKISKQEKERFAELMEGYFQSDRKLKLVVQLVDMRHKPTADDEEIIKYMMSANIPFIIVMTKSDKLKPTEYKKRLELSKEELAFAKDVEIIPFSAKTGEGADRIKKLIEEAIA